MRRYQDLDLGLADASVVALAGRLHTLNILTLDERHFRAIEVAPGRAARLLPFDAC
jgi:predicted nucleic acid-binding protein